MTLTAGALGMATMGADTALQGTPTLEKEWELPSMFLRDNGLRGDVILNGFWLGKPADASKAAEKVRVPDDGVDRKAFEYTREFTLPKGWEKRRLLLELGPVTEDGSVILNGKELGPVLKNKTTEFALPQPVEGKQSLTVRTGVVNGDIWLRSLPADAPQIEDSYLMTSFRNKEVRIRLAGKAAKGIEPRPVVKLYADKDGKELVKTIDAKEPLKIAGDGAWQCELAAEWKDAKLWSRWHPNLYYYTVEIVDASGTTSDKLLPRRFGFREVWIEDGRFVINGVPITGCGDSWEGAVGYNNAVKEQAERMIKNLKAMGLCMGFRVKCDVMMDVADELGFLIDADAGSLVRINIWDPKSGLTDMSGHENLEEITARVKRLREHPAIICWGSNAPFSHNTLYAGQVGLDPAPWDYFPDNRNAPRAREAHLIFKKMTEFLSQLDPTRAVATSNSPFSPIETCTRYLCDNLDLQEREQFFDYWAQSGRPKVIWAHEFGAPFQGHYYIRRTSFQHPHTGAFPKIHTELAARLFGEDVYVTEPDDLLRRWPTMWYDEHRTTPLVQKAVSEQVYNIWRAWRTQGVNASAHHIATADAFALPTKKKAEERYGLSQIEDPRRPGLSRITKPTGFPLLDVDQLLPGGQAYLRGTNPLLAYIGGPDGQFNTKDHLFYAGTPVRKAAIVLNDWDDPAALEGGWRLVDAKGAVIASGAVKGEVNPGARALTQFPIEFEAPKVDTRTDYMIELELKANLPGALSDRFALTVFPKVQPKPITFSGTIWKLNLSDDRVHERQHFFWNRDNESMLKAAGVDATLVKGLKTFEYMGYSPDAVRALDKSRELVTAGTPAPGDLLLIPRHCLRTFTDDRQLNLRLLEEMGLDKLIEDGLRVIVFEQNLPNILGVNTEDTRPRRVFMAAKGHPVFDGLEPSDLTYWSGDADLCDSFSPITMSEREFPDRVWHTSNLNAVASKPLIRPQVGAARALAVNGFDLGESPLLEVAKGKGRILFCQMDVTNRYGVDPAATRLVDNILRYMTSVEPPDPAKSAVALLKPDDKEVVMRKEVFRAAKPEGKAGWGITQGELLFRESLYDNNWLTKKLPAKEMPVLAGAEKEGRPLVIRTDAATGQHATTIDESLFQTGWSKRKAAWLKAALIINQGGSLKDGPGLAHHGRQLDLYPHVWVENFVHPYTGELW